MAKPKVILFGKLPPPYLGPAIATQILLSSSLNNHFQLVHFDTTLNKDLSNMGKWSFGKFVKSREQRKKLQSILKAEQPNLALIPISQTTMGFMKDAVFINQCAKNNTKVLIQLRGSNFLNWINNAPAFVKWYVRKTLKKCDGVIVLGENLKYLFEDYFSPSQIYVVPNGADYEIPKGNTETINVLYLANFMHNKGFAVLLTAYALLPKEIQQQTQLHAVGDWFETQYKEVCKKIIQENNLEVYFHSPANRKEKMQHFANASLFVFAPVAPEGLPWVTVEAMAAGLPIVATSQGAISEVVKNNETGFIVEPNSPKEIADKIELLLKDNTVREKMAAAARVRYETHFTEEKMIEKMTAAFSSALST